MNRTKRTLLNPKEAEVNERLQSACDRVGANVFTKVRVADVLRIERSGIRDELFDYALRAHFDFLIGDDEPKALFAVELDSHFHESPEAQARDAKKNELCDRFDLPLLRVTSEYLEQVVLELDLLTWLVEVWFAQEWFAEEKAAGRISYDESFDPRFVSRAFGRDEFPFWLARPAMSKVRAAFLRGLIPVGCVSSFVGVDDDGRLAALGCLKLSENEAVRSEAQLYQNHERFCGAELLDELVVLQTADRALDVLESDGEPEAIDETVRAVQAFVDSHRVRLGGGSGDGIYGEIDWSRWHQGG